MKAMGAGDDVGVAGVQAVIGMLDGTFTRRAWRS